MYILLLICHIANSVTGSIQSESTLNKTNLDNTSTPQNVDTYETIHIELSTINETLKNGTHTDTLKVDDNNIGVKISFSDNTTELIKQWITVLEQLNDNIASYATTLKPTTMRHMRRDFQGLPDLIPTYFRKKRSIDNLKEIETNNIHVTSKTIQDVPNSTRITNPNVESKPNIHTTSLHPNKPKSTIVTNKESAETTTEIYKKHDKYIKTDDIIAKMLNKTNEENRNNTGTAIEEKEHQSGRRSFNSDMEIANVIRTRLLSYVHENINDTMYKIDSLKNVKHYYATDNAYNVGYVVANIDLISINLKKLKDSIDKDHQRWAESHILDLFDKVKYTNDVVTSLLNTLKTIFKQQKTDLTRF